MISDRNHYFKRLDSLRFLCFLSVFFYHSFFTNYVHLKELGFYHFVTRDVFANGNLGVNFFFVLSGFLITHLLIQERQFTGKIDVWKFWIRRVLRIWPLYFVCVFFGFVVFPKIKQAFGLVPEETANPIYYILFISNFDLIASGLPDAAILGVLWSVSIEEQFYFFWPLILLLLPVRKCWIVFLVIIVSSFVFRLFNTSRVLQEFHTLSCIGDMAFGGLAAWLFSNFFQSDTPKLPKYAIVSGYLVFIAFYFFRTEIASISQIIGALDRTIIAASISLIILDQSFSDKSLIDFSKCGYVNRLGRISYGLYCLHFFGILVTLQITSILGVNTKLWHVMFLEPMLALFITIIISEISFRILETPFLKIKRKFSPLAITTNR